MRLLLVPTTLAFPALAALAQTPTGGGHLTIARPEKIAWGPAPALLPAGAQLAVLEGDPGQPGPFTMRLRVPDGYRIPPHYHPVVEHVTVVQGTFQVGLGERFDPGALTDLPAGTFAALAPGMRHFARAKAPTVIQPHGTGPWSLTYVNPADDPRGRAAAP